MAKISGTREWASTTKNYLKGCSHDCKYCYARSMALQYQQMTAAEWSHPTLNEREIKKGIGKRRGTIMFPTTSDILPEFLDSAIAVLEKLFSHGNKVLIVSKPHLACIQAICERFVDHKENILFRFTIGSFDDDILGYWEPHAPRFLERQAALKHAFDAGFQTSVSVEPMLDTPRIVELFEMLEPFVTDSIWIGKMNKVGTRVDIFTEEDEKRVAKIRAEQTDEKIWEVYNLLRDEPKVKWKESIKSIVGLPLATEAGTDE